MDFLRVKTFGDRLNTMQISETSFIGLHLQFVKSMYHEMKRSDDRKGMCHGEAGAE